MKLTKALFVAAAVTAFSASTASAITAAQCTEVGGTVNLATASCEMTAAQEAMAADLGYTAGGAATTAGAGAGMGTVGAGAGAAAAGAGLFLAIVLVGDGSSGTTTTN